MGKSSKLKEIYILVFNIILTLGILVVVLRLWEKDIFVPISFQNDGLGAVATVKSMIEGDGAWYRSYWSAPFGETNYMIDYIFPLMIIKPLTLVIRDAAVVINIFWLLTYVFTAITTYILLRKVGCRYHIAIFGSIIYNFLPYHFFRIEHFWLCGCYIVPLSFILILNLWGEINYREKYYKLYKIKISKDFLVNTILCLLIGLNGIYYAVFTVILLMCVGFISLFNEKRIRILIKAFIEIVFIFVPIVAIYVLPTIILSSSQMKAQMNTRSIFDIETYALKVSALLFPVQGHRLKFLSDFTSKYSEIFALTNENYTVVLGMIMSIGFILSLVAVFCGKLFKTHGSLFRKSGLINIIIILISCQGGFADYVGIFLTSAIRCFNRMSIFIALASILLVCVLLGDIFSNLNMKILWQNIVIVILCILGVLDQVPDKFSTYSLFDPAKNEYVLTYKEKEEEYYNLKKYFHSIQNRIGDDATIYMYPRHPYYGENNKPFAPIKAYVCGESLKWSYSEWNTKYDEWFSKKEQTNNIEQLIKIISCLDMSGIMIDSDAFENEESFNDVYNKLNNILKIKPIVYEKGNLYFYDITNYKKQYLKQFSAKKIKQIYNAIEKDMDNIDVRYINNKDIKLISGKKCGDEIVVEKEDKQYGPYINLQEGKYRITVLGENLESVEVDVTSGIGKKQEHVSNVVNSDNYITYEFELNNETSNVEFLSYSNSNNYIIYGYFIEKDVGEGFHDVKKYYRQQNLLYEAEITTDVSLVRSKDLKVGDDTITIVNGEMLLNPNDLQYGPYYSLNAGKYEVEIRGDNLESLSPSVKYNFGEDEIKISNIERKNNRICYYFELNQAVENIEFLLVNGGDKVATISSYAYEEIGVDRKLIKKILEIEQ